MKHPHPKSGADARGGVRLVFDGACGGVADLDLLHGSAGHAVPSRRRAPVVGAPVLHVIEGGASRCGDGLEALIAPFEGLLPAGPSPRRTTLVAALNGVLGDHLLRSGNPLAITMQLRRDGQRIDASEPLARVTAAGGRILLLVHGVGLSDGSWRRDGHDHGMALARELGFTPLYARYNSGLHVSTNARALAALLDDALRHWPVAPSELVLIGHGMGGLVARSACHQAAAAGLAWPAALRALVFLGTPHHGAPLERTGRWLHRAMDLSPCAAPFAGLSRIRSEGIADLLRGNLLDADWIGRNPLSPHDCRAIVALPAGVACYAIAATVGSPRAHIAGSLCGDGVVPVASALGQHADARRALAIPHAQQWIGHGMHHLDLLGSAAVYRRLRRWLGG